MRSSRRALSMIAFAAAYAVVMAAGPSLHGWVGSDHGASCAIEASGQLLQSPGHSGDDCAICHLLSLSQHRPDATISHPAPRVARVSRPVRVFLPPLESRAVSPPRAPPASPRAIV